MDVEIFSQICPLQAEAEAEGAEYSSGRTDSNISSRNIDCNYNKSVHRNDSNVDETASMLTCEGDGLTGEDQMNGAHILFVRSLAAIVPRLSDTSCHWLLKTRFIIKYDTPSPQSILTPTYSSNPTSHTGDARCLPSNGTYPSISDEESKANISPSHQPLVNHTVHAACTAYSSLIVERYKHMCIYLLM
jgi:hypothetical protein